MSGVKFKHFNTLEELCGFINESKKKDSGFKPIEICFDGRVGKYLVVYAAEDLLLEEDQ